MGDTDPKVNSRAIISTAFKGVDWRKTVKAFGMLSACVFSLVFLVAAPFELFLVHAVNNWPPQPARLISVTRKIVDSTPGADAYWSYELELTKTGESISTSDVRPGDLPFTILLWSTSDWDAARYRAGQNIEVYRAPEGGKVYLERGGYGFMSMVLAASLAFWAWIVLRVMRRKG
jgi:hypothetical protein